MVFIINVRELWGERFSLFTIKGHLQGCVHRLGHEVATLKYECAKSAVDTGFTKGYIYRKKEITFFYLYDYIIILML